MNFLIAQCRSLLGQLNVRSLRKLMIAIVGGSVLLVGGAMIVLPGPAIVVVPLGLAILATEFIWARRWLKRAKELFQKKNAQPSSLATANGNVWHQLSADDVAKLLGVNFLTGLSVDEVQQRQKEFGLNRVTARRGPPAWRKFLQQFNQPLQYILLLATVITAILGEWVDSSVIFGVVFINAIVGYLQEAKASKAIEALAKMVATETNVRRAGKKTPHPFRTTRDRRCGAPAIRRPRAR